MALGPEPFTIIRYGNIGRCARIQIHFEAILEQMIRGFTERWQRQ
jgi:hypothetical protein